MRLHVTQSPARRRLGFNLVELLIALAITAVMLTATLMALNASFTAYQRTTEEASTHTIGRLAMHRMLALIRTGTEFGPFPIDPQETTVTSNFIEFVTATGQVMSLEWDEADETLYIVLFDAESGLETLREALLEGVVAQVDADGDPIPPFTMDYLLGYKLYRATIDLAIVPDDSMDVELDGENTNVIRLVASAMPRVETY